MPIQEDGKHRQYGRYVTLIKVGQIDILIVLLKARKHNKLLTSKEIKDLVIEERKKQNLQLTGIASSNIRRHLRRLKEKFIVEIKTNRYRINENLNLTEIFEEKIERFLLDSIIRRIKEYTEKIDKEF